MRDHHWQLVPRLILICENNRRLRKVSWLPTSNLGSLVVSLATPFARTRFYGSTSRRGNSILSSKISAQWSAHRPWLPALPIRNIWLWTGIFRLEVGWTRLLGQDLWRRLSGVWLSDARWSEVDSPVTMSVGAALGDHHHPQHGRKAIGAARLRNQTT